MVSQATLSTFLKLIDLQIYLEQELFHDSQIDLLLLFTSCRRAIKTKGDNSYSRVRFMLCQELVTI